MSNAAPRLFDRTILPLKYARAATLPKARFLLERAADDLATRLSAVMRPFPDAGEIGTLGPEMAAAMAAPGRKIITLATDPSPGIAFDKEANPDDLSLGTASYDLLVSGFLLQSVDDLPGVLFQIRRALRPDGLFMGCMLGGRTLHELRDVLASAESEIAGGISPRVFPFADVRDMGGLLQRAGFALPVADIEPLTVRYSDLLSLARDLRAMAATNILHGRLKWPSRRALFLRAAELYAQRHADADGRIRATFETVWISGWAPHESQQQPLRPGSAKARLADALKVPEVPLRP
jgi:SAM-dependent methyltransferase